MKNSRKDRPLELSPLEALPGRKPLGQHVFEKLKQAIIRGDLAPGDRIVAIQVAEALDISRTPVREEIHKLEERAFSRNYPKAASQ